MILLDTNVLSELAKPQPEPRVLRWLDALDPAETWICSITVGEIQLGVALLPEGKRKAQLAAMADATIREFASMCATFDALAALEYASIMAARRKMGRPMEVEDAQIAAIARSVGLTLATRDTEDFSDIDGLTVIDPWTADEDG